jgi:D-amino-acid dehydrogenase
MLQHSNIAIIGAGIVGLSTALWLQRFGHTVTIIDRGPPGMGTSFGNAGVFADYACLPFSKMQTLYQLPNMLLDKDSPLCIQGSYLPKLFPYSIEFAKACRPKQYLKGCQTLSELLKAAPDADTVLFNATSAEKLINREGSLALFDSKNSLEKASNGQLQERINNKVDVQFLSANEAQELEPNLAPFHIGGVLYPNTYNTTNPSKLCQLYAEHFQKNGGIFIRSDVKKIIPGKEIKITTADTNHEFSSLVLAAGTASANLLHTLGISIPLVSERGYHLEINNKSALTRPVSWANKSVFLTPMEQHTRVAGIAEFAHSNAPQNEQKLKNLLGFAERMLGHELEPQTTWVGSRPSTPDSLPLIGPLVTHPNIILAFGHGHLGLTLGSITGKLVAQLLSERPSSLDLTALSPSRFL